MGFGDGGFDGGGGDDGGDYGFDGGQGYDDGQGYGQDPGGALAEAFHQGAGLQDQIAHALAPISSAVADMQADRDADMLLSQYPQLENGEFAEAVIEHKLVASAEVEVGGPAD